VLRQLLPDGLMAALASAVAAKVPTTNTPATGASAAPAPLDVATMSAQIATLTQRLATHQQAIEQLKKRKG
jgi:hypothetical protein